MKNSDNDFREGQLDYRIATGLTPVQLAEEIAGATWRDGFVAFAAAEKRLAKLIIPLDEKFFRKRIQNIAGANLTDAEGYVTEIGLWRSDGARFVEIAAEREENTWTFQRWELDTAPTPGTGNCWHRAAETKPGSHHKGGKHLFTGDLPTIEVVWPEYRLNFFITRG